MIGNETMFGQIATFVRDTGLTYHEVVYEVPYRHLVMMQKDILHEATGDIIIEMSGRDFMNRRGGKKDGKD